MKRIFKVVCVALSCVLCLCFVGGCNNSPIITTYEDAVQALKNVGYENAYCDNLGEIYLGTDNGVSIWIAHGWKAEMFEEGWMARSDVHDYSGYMSSNTDFESCKHDCANMLDTIMPMYDMEYSENALDIINQSLGYQKNHIYENEYKNGDYSTKHIQFKKNTYTVTYYITHYHERNTDIISVDIYEN